MFSVKSYNIRQNRNAITSAFVLALPLIAGVIGCASKPKDVNCNEPVVTRIEDTTKQKTLKIQGVCLKVGGEFSTSEISTDSRLTIVIGCKDETLVTMTQHDDLQIVINDQKQPFYVEIIFDPEGSGINLQQTACAFKPSDNEPAISRPWYYAFMTR